MLLLIVAAVASIAQARIDERVAQTSLPGFTVGHRQESANGMIIEWIPAGETVRAWSRMVTVQRFTGASRRLRPQDLLDNMTNGLRSGCPGAVSSPVSLLTVSGRPAARYRADCPRNPATGLPETYIALAIAGSNDLHVAQVAFRRVPTSVDARWAEAQLQSVRLCDERSREAICASD